MILVTPDQLVSPILCLSPLGSYHHRIIILMTFHLYTYEEEEGEEARVHSCNVDDDEDDITLYIVILFFIRRVSK